MLTKHLLTISLLLPFMAISSAVYANHNNQTSSEPARRVCCVQPGRSHTSCFQDGFARTPVVATTQFSEGMHLSRGTQIRLVDLSIDALGPD